MLDIRCLLTQLAESRKVFHSEADFQHALAWHIHQTMQKSQIRLEYPVPVEHRKMYVDIYLPDEKIAIELKYVTRRLELHNGESFALRNQFAHNQRRYDFLRDIQRLECMRFELGLCKAGHAVLLTNDPLYWNEPGRPDTPDSNFRIHEGRKNISGKLAWVGQPSPGTTKGREKPIRLKDSYCLRWQDYSDCCEKEGSEFRYLAVSVN